MLTKTQIFDTVENMNDQISLDEMIDRLILMERVNTGLYQSENGMVHSEVDARKKLSKWLE